MKAIVGLGNPGTQYERTRHNVGFLVIDELVSRGAPGEIAKSRFNAAVIDARINDEKVLLVKPLTYMNRSGQSVLELVRFYQLDPRQELVVIVDDVALPLGDIRIRPSGSAGTHNGLTDIENRIGTQAYPRLRIGIDDPGMIDRVNYVLGRFTEDERPIIESAIRRAADACECWVREGVTTAMNRFNSPRRKQNPPDERESRGDELDNHNGGSA